MAFEATKNFKKKSAGGRFEATSNFGVDDTVISSRVNAISKDIESLYNDYYKDYTERSKYVLGVDSKYENMQAPGLKVSMQSYKDRAKKIKQSIEDNKAFLTPEGYLAALQNVNSIIDTDTTEDDKTFSDYFNSSAAAGGRDKFNKIVEERAAAQSALKKAGLNENSKYRDIEAALSDRTIDAGAAPDEMGQGRRYQGRKLTSEDKDYLSSLLLTEDKVSTMTDDEILRKIKDKGNPSYKQKIALGEIDRLTKRNEELIKLAEADGNVSSFNPYGDYAEEYANNQQRMEKLRNMIDNDYAGRDVAYYYTDDNGNSGAMSWENLYYERKVGNAYKAATDKGYGGYNSAAAAAYDEINFIEKVTDAMQWLSENSTVSAEKKKPYLDIVKEYDEKYGTNYAKEDGIYSIETKNRINSEIKNSDALNKLKENFKSESGATYDAVKDYAKLQRDKERAAKVQETVQTAVEGVNSVPVVGKALGGIASAISAVPFALVSGTDYIFNLMDSIGHSDYNSDSFRPINTYDDYATNISGEIIGAQTEIYDKAMQEAGVSERARKFWTSTYSGVSSGINSLATVVGSCYAFGPAAGQVVASVILSGQAASSGLQEAVQNGSTTNEALAYGFASGVAEYLGEKISIGSLVDKFLESSFDVTSFKSFMKSFVKDKNLLKMLGQGAVEGSEEVVTEIMNRFSDAVINQDHSKFSNAILTYEAEGLSREEAKKKAFLDVLASAAEQAWGGFVGGIMGGTAAVIGGGVSAARNSVADIKNQTDIGKSIAGTDAGKNVLEIAEKRGFDISKASEEVPEGRGVGKLVSKVRNAVRNRNMGKLAQNVVEAELKAAKETAMPIVNNNESLAEMVAEIATGTADVSAISALSANGVLTEENVEKVFEALEAVQKRTETSEVRNMINDIVETKESSEGKAYNASSIYGIKREGGKTKYILEDGTEVDSGEFGLTSKDKTLFVNAVKGMTDAEANEMISAYRKYANGTDKGVFATTWGLYRSLGETGAAKNGERVAGYKSRIYFTQNAEVNNVLVTSAIEQGVKARAQSEMKRNIKARAERVIQERGRAKGEVRGEEHLGKNKSGAKNVARTLAKLGYDVEFLSEDAKLHGKRIGDTLINGAYDEKTNTIYLRADATYNATDVRGILGHTLAHEVTHSIKVWSEADYNVLTDYIRDALDADFDALVKEKMDKLGMSYAMASDEVIADGCEMLLRDSKALEKLAMENANLFVKVVTKVREFIANLRKAQTDMYDGNEELHDAALKLREALKSLEEVQEVFDNALENSIRNMRNALAEAENAKTRENLDVLEKQAEKEGLQLSEETDDKYDFTKSFAEQVEDFKNGKFPQYDTLLVGGTPQKWQSVGFNALPVTLNQTHVDYALNGTKNFNHTIGEALLKNLPEAIKDPIAIIQSQSKGHSDRAMVIFDFKHNGSQVISAIEIDGTGRTNNIVIDSNAMTTIFAKKNSLSQLKSAIEHTNKGAVELFYWDKNRAVTLLQRAGLQLPSALPHDGSVNSIRDSKSNVKTKFENVTETQQFKRWFGDWQKHPSKINPIFLDADGKPKVFYHGAKKNGGFTVFRNWQYFTDKKSYAERYAERGNSKALYAVYLTADKVFDTRDAQARDIYNSIRSEYGLSELQDTGLPDWTDGYDISEYLDEHPELGYDAIILDEGGDLVDGKPVSRGLSIVVKDSSQIKSATDNIGTFDKGNKDIRYSEETSEQRENALTSFTDDDVKKYVNKAVRRFHTTYSLKKAAYLTTTGSMLDFSDGQGYRVQDHREISDILDLPDDAGYSDGMIYFMNMGNIRLQTYGIDIAAMPNAKQVSMLRSIIPSIMRENDGFYLDVSDSRGNNVFSREYGEGTSTSKIISDIQNYFKDGTIPKEQSDLREFMFSEETSEEFAENEKSAIEKALANMSVKDYNRRGWLRTLLTREDASKLYSAVAELFANKKRKEFRLKDGSYAVEVNNKIIFVSGTFENPRYESVLVFNTDNATDMEALKYYFFGDTATNDLTVKDIKRFINQRRNYGQVYGFNGEDYKASGKRDFGRAKLRNGTKGFGDISQFEVRDGVYTKDEGNVSLRVQGLKFSEETETSRDTLVSDMEAVAETDEEKSFVEKLKSEVKKANALQKELAETNRKIKEISFTKGTDRSALPSLNEEKERIAKKLNRLDSKFYGYRGYDTFKTLAERKSKEAVIAEKLRSKAALRSQKQKYQEAAQGIKDTLAQREENRRRREIVRDIAKRIDKLDKLAKEDSKTKHIPSALRDIVKAFREQIDSRTQNYDERIARAENAIVSLEKRRGKYLDAYTEYTQLAERIKQYDKGSKDYADADARMGQLKQDFDSYNSLTEQIEKKLSSIEKSGERNVRAADYLSEMLSYYKTYDNADSTYYIDVSDLARAIEDLRHSIGERPLYLLTADQLEDVLAVTKAVQKKISDANKLFRSSRSVSETTAKVAGETKDARNKKVSRSDFVRGAKDRTANMLFWNNLKPYELFKQSGSDTLYQLYRNLQRAEGDSGRLILKYADKYRETAQKYGIKEKMFNQKFDITFDNGKTARLTGGEILTLYLTAKRGQGRVHLLGDGFRLEGGKMRLVADGKETVYANADMMTLTENDLTKFGKTLSDDMRRFGDEMQKYMSTEIAADGNAVSMKLYDIMLFGEDNYITLTVDNNYLRSTIDPKKNTAKLKNSKFTIKTVANATQALSISSFVNVYQTHASDMAAYAAFTLPLEDITKVINGTSKSEDGSTRVRDVLGSKLYGEMMKFLTDVNGGIRSDGDLAYMRLFSAVKAARTGLNLAVAIQQPCAVMRAFAEINPKYFIGVKAKTMSEAQQRKSLAEMTQYASTWVVKQLGGVDINTKQSIGKTITDLGAKGNTFGHTAAKGLQEGQFWVAEKLDQVTWMWIWNACRNEAIDNFKKSNADYTYKDVLKKAGDRFDEITNKTQVYDSIFARSKIMRDGKAFEKFITQFMAEPMTTLNMVYDGVRLLLNGEKGKAAGIFASLIASQIFTAAIRSFADAFRDDDDDKNYWEKYLQAFIENSIDNINPFMLLPWFKDIYSLVFNGFNVDRPDVEIIGDLMTKVKKLAKVWGDESKNAKERAEASWDALSILADMSGVAMTSLTRDFRAIYRTIATEWQSATKTTTNTAADTAWKNGLSRNLTTPRDDKGKLYYAFMNDDDTYIARTQDRLGEKDFRRRVIDCLKDNDIRIAEAAAAHMDGDYEKYDSIIRDIANDGFDKEYVVAAVVSAENKALKDSADEDEDVDTVSQIDGMTATKKDIIADVEEGNYDLLEEYYRLKVDYYKEKEADDPEGKAFTSVRSLLSGHYRDLYKDGDEDERERIADILGDVTVDGHKVIKKSTVRKWKED
jgi:hypothetical protein